MLAEFGGIAVRPQLQGSAVGPEHEKIWGYTTTQSVEEFGVLYKPLIKTFVHAELFSGFCNTQFADTFQEGNGLLNADRSPKFPLARIHAATAVPRSWIPGMV